METIAQLLEHKGNEVYSIRSDEQVFEAIRMMADKRVGALMVLDDGALVGVISERDYARKVILEGKSSRSTPVAEIMTRDVITVDAHTTVDRGLKIMSQNKIRHLPVIDEEQLVGVLSIGDLVKSVIDDQKHQIQSLEQYIVS